MTTTWRSVLCLLAAVGCQAVGAAQDPQPAPGPSERFERDMVVRFHMHQSYELVRAIDKLLIRGNLDDARAFAQAIAEAPEVPGLAPWAPRAALVRERAAAVASAASLEDACRRGAGLAEACAGCHLDAGVAPEFRAPAPPPDHPTIDARMARHLWAANRLWEGVVGGAEGSWREGLDVLAATPLPAAPIARDELARKLQQLADQARRQQRSTTPAARARVYGELLVTCAGCHTKRSAEHAGAN
jgi:cytochrome c553